MKVENYTDIAEAEVTMEGTKDATMRMLISDKDGANNFAMRMFTVKPGGHTPYHHHNYEHEVFVLEGSGILRGESAEHPFAAGDSIFIKPDEKHQFRNAGDSDMKFLCLIPTPEKCA